MLKIVLAATVSSFFFGLFGVNWDSIDEKIDREFPAVSFISTDELSQLYDSSDIMPLIIDVREEGEFAVSHLSNAQNLKTGEDVASLVQDRDAPIVVYCSVGYRSAGVAAKLESLGYTNVKNLKHSIFEWANKGYPMRNSLGETEKAHPFNRTWGSLLDTNLHQYETTP